MATFCPAADFSRAPGSILINVLFFPAAVPYPKIAVHAQKLKTIFAADTPLQGGSWHQ